MKKNLFYSSITISSRAVTGFFLLFVMARLLSVQQFGLFTYALVASNLLVLLVDYGYNLKLSKDTSKSPEKINVLTVNTLYTKIILSAIILSVLIFIKILNIWADEEFNIVAVFSIAAILNSFANHFLIPYRSINKFNVEAKYVFINNIAIFLSSFIVGYIYRSVIMIAFSFIIFKFFFLLIVLLRFKKDFGFIKVDYNFFTDIKQTFPYAIHVIVGALYLNIDTIILKNFVSFHEIGIYQAGMKIIGASSILLGIFNNTIIPKFSFISDNKSNLIKLATKINLLVVGIGILIAVVLMLFPDEIISILYTNKFIELNQYIYLFALIILLRYLGVVYGAILTISDKQKIRSFGVFCTLILIVIFDLIIIPQYHLWGALITLVIAHVLLNLVYIIFVYKEYNCLFFKNRLILKPKQAI